MKILIVDNAEPEDSAFNRPLIEMVSRLTDQVEVAGYRDVRLNDEVSGIILSGVPLHYEFESVDKRQPYIQWLQGINVPVLGICLGHQSIGTFFGATILRNIEAEKGPRTMQVLRDDVIFSGLPQNFPAMTLHRASIPVPDSFVALARSKQCANQVMRHAERKIYGMQFHPELSKSGEMLVGNFIRIARSSHGHNVPVRSLDLADA